MIPTVDQVLEKLVGFDTTSRNSNLQLIDYMATLLREHSVEPIIIKNDDRSKANLYATIGPQDQSGIMLSGHTDVVPIEGQQWNYPAFTLTKENERFYGRGTADMKGFVACALVAAVKASNEKLKTPLHLAFSYDEEIGCVGVHSLLDMLNQAPVKPSMCIVGEPTELNVATKHKGKMSIVARCKGTEGHSAFAPNYQNAIHLASDLISALRDVQTEIIKNYGAVAKQDVPYTTVHVGRVQTTQALNIVPNLCTVHFEIRFPKTDNPDKILRQIKERTQHLIKIAQHRFSDADVEFDVLNRYPALDTPVDNNAVRFVQSLLDTDATTHVAFGTEAGLFSEKSGIPAVICGPGSMEQGHKPDEFVTVGEIRNCERFLQNLIAHLVTH